MCLHELSELCMAGLRPLGASCLDLHCRRCLMSRPSLSQVLHVATSTVARKSISQPPSAPFGLLVADNTLLVIRTLWTDHVAWLGVMAPLEAVLTELMFALGALGHG